MLKLQIPSIELYDEEKNEFIYEEAFTVELEHSLFAMSKWESKYKKPFLSKEAHSKEEVLYYIRCMANRDLTDSELSLIAKFRLKEIDEYINDPMTATWFKQTEGEPRYRGSGEAVTSELVYYWLVALNIPFECQHWHLNRLLTLVRICNLKNKPQKGMSKGAILRSNAELNKARRAKLHSKG